jgi:hypothetical protein
MKAELDARDIHEQGYCCWRSTLVNRFFTAGYDTVANLREAHSARPRWPASGLSCRARARSGCHTSTVAIPCRVAGRMWHHRRSGRKLAITVEPLLRLAAPQRRPLDDEAALMATITQTTRP